jgi:Txe/YoeB family toxin of Txe-Axe toxin-antitoxin module
MSNPTFMDAVVLFVRKLQQCVADVQGDSLTEASAAGSLTQRMAEYYVRRFDVINRGFGGR